VTVILEYCEGRMKRNEIYRINRMIVKNYGMKDAIQKLFRNLILF